MQWRAALVAHRQLAGERRLGRSTPSTNPNTSSNSAATMPPWTAARGALVRGTQRDRGFDLVAATVDVEVEAPRARPAGERAVVVGARLATLGGHPLAPALAERRRLAAAWSRRARSGWRARRACRRARRAGRPARRGRRTCGRGRGSPGPPRARSSHLVRVHRRSAPDQAAGESAVVEGLEQRVPRQRGALDPHRELDDALQRLEVAERHLGVAGASPSSSTVVDRHHPLEPPDERRDLGDRLPLTAWLIIDAELCEIEQPWPPTLTSVTDAVGRPAGTPSISSPHSGLCPCGVDRRRRGRARHGCAACGSGRG